MGLDRGRQEPQLGREAVRMANGSDPEVEIPAPPARRCPECGVVLGNVSKVHYATARDVRPCLGSWK